MPIYAYRCATCGHAKDVLQKMSDPLLTTCPSCGAETFVKQLTAAGFQLKGSGWYVTDFKGGPPAAKPDTGSIDTSKDTSKADAAQAGASSEPAAKAADNAAPAAATSSPPAPAPSASPAPTPSGPAPAAK